jgi:hypothetical protein
MLGQVRRAEWTESRVVNAKLCRLQALDRQGSARIIALIEVGHGSVGTHGRG